MPIQKKKKKKKEEFDASLMGGFLPGLSPSVNFTIPIQSSRFGSPFFPDPGWPIKPTSFIANYRLYFLMPTPFEQVGTLLDPLAIQEPPHRYATPGGGMRLVVDIAGDVHLLRAAWDPSTLPMVEPIMAYGFNPYSQAIHPGGVPDPFTQRPELNEIFAQSSAAVQ